MSDFSNRLAKNAAHRLKWAQRQGLTAFRLYDLDMPDWPVAVDWYAGFAHVMIFPSRKLERTGLDAFEAAVRAAVIEALEVDSARVFVKTHSPKKWGEAQYERVGHQATTVVVDEGGSRFECNLSDFLDTGLFLDHRTTRLRVRGESRDKRVLNLFAYTGAFTVHACAGGARSTTSVDLSNTYCEWAGRNLALNGVRESPHHRVVRDDVIAWLTACRETFDLIVLDPPSFSASKKMQKRFEVQKDHKGLIERALARLASGGSLYFSTNFTSFALDPSLRPAEELTPASIPDDFRRTVHQCWRFVGS